MATRDTSLGVGVYFALDDYVGILRRVVIMFVDLIVLITFYIAFNSIVKWTPIIGPPA